MYGHLRAYFDTNRHENEATSYTISNCQKEPNLIADLFQASAPSTGRNRLFRILLNWHYTAS
jgi:hypothetical protein